ncbi:ATP-dependent DNA helicase [Frankliniella fusca]|uniref:ATP-dependent DNA helicase n=1 Tax=Frankliniella fusca TaxID=407009 RepID=A0AAE1GVH4_9NEOP|nr:ATP-dependent DNA helicase [Frankliniella fusca]
MYRLNGALRILYEWLSFRATHQQTLKAESYHALRRFVEQEAHRQGRRFGKIVILPRGMYGSQRHMKELFYDALAVSQKTGHPSWMITLTCNRKWPEIVEECRRSNTDPIYRYDVVNRAFEMRVTQLLSDVVREQIFGKVTGEMTVREFQGRGLTRTYGLYIMRPEDTPTCGQDIDKILWAHFPDEAEDPELFDLVKRYMVHGPCDQNSSCHKKNGKCRFCFPCDFRDDTDITGKRPLYRRPNDGRGFWKRENGEMVFIENRWVIPYNPVLLLRCKGHLNIMYSPSTSACKYFYGYLFKGSYGNKVHISMVKRNERRPPNQPFDHDEIQEFKEMRHMGPYEAHYYIMGVSQAHIYPPVEVLPVHEEMKETIIYVEGNEQRALERHEGTKLTAWLELNRNARRPRNKLYTDVVEDYMYKGNAWQPSNRHTIGRMASLATTGFNSELHHIRLLLCNRTDITSFEHLRTVEGQVHPTYKSACEALNLAENEEEMRLVMYELLLEQFPSTYRKTFAIILAHDEELCYQLALRDISEVLGEYGKILQDYDLPPLDDGVLQRNRKLPEEDAVLDPAQADELVTTLNEEQRQFFDAVTSAVNNENDKKKYFFLTGPGGTGKTYTYNVLIDYLLSREKQVVLAAYTGVGASLLKNGRTSHKAFGLPFEDECLGLSRSNLKLQSAEAQNP